jgi:hypothetical protein
MSNITSNICLMTNTSDFNKFAKWIQIAIMLRINVFCLIRLEEVPLKDEKARDKVHTKTCWWDW